MLDLEINLINGFLKGTKMKPTMENVILINNLYYLVQRGVSNAGDRSVVDKLTFLKFPLNVILFKLSFYFHCMFFLYIYIRSIVQKKIHQQKKCSLTLCCAAVV